ncbi:Wzz/FepE/Etk N-terminal domain-containing protein [Thermodesulfobacteriota bacterium]
MNTKMVDNSADKPTLDKRQPIDEIYPYAEEDEINLLDLFLVLLKHKIFIAGMIFITGIAAVTYSLGLTNIYRSEATIALRGEKETGSNPLSRLGGFGGMVAGEFGLGGGGTLEKLEVVLTSRNLARRVIKKHKLMPIIFLEDWDVKKKKWQVDPAPTLQDAEKMMRDGLLKVDSDSKKSTIVVSIEHEDPELAKKIVEYYIKELSETLREEVLSGATENQRFFKQQLEKTSDSLLKEKIYNMLAGEIEKEMFARGQKYYGFVVLDPPITSDPDKKVKPKRSIICILSVMVAFFLAVFLSFFMEFIDRIKTDDPERYEKLQAEIRFRKRNE